MQKGKFKGNANIFKGIKSPVYLSPLVLPHGLHGWTYSMKLFLKPCKSLACEVVDLN